MINQLQILNSPRSKQGYISQKSIYVFIAAVLYASFIVFFPWIFIIKTEEIKDFDRVVEYYNSIQIPKSEIYGWTSLVQYLTGEALWDTIVLSLTSITGEASVSLHIISFFICMVWGIFLFSRMPVGWALAFLLNPISIDVVISGIRNGFAWSLVILGLMVTRIFFKYSILLITPFIHTSSVAFLMLIFSVKKIIRPLSSKLNVILIAVGSGAAIALSLTVFKDIVFSITGDRRAVYEYVRGGGSYLHMLFFIILIFTQLMCNIDYIKKHGIAISLIAWYLVMNPFIPWSFRIWGAAIPLIAYAIWELPGKKKQIILFLWIGNLSLWYLYWTKLFNYWYYWL